MSPFRLAASAAALAFLPVVAALAAPAGRGGAPSPQVVLEPCTGNELAGDWGMVFADDEPGLCNLKLDATGEIERGECYSRTIGPKPLYSVSGRFEIHQGCSVTGTITVKRADDAGPTTRFEGQLGRARDTMMGILLGPDKAFVPAQIIRTR